ncbi:hypothetical protein ACI1UB_09920 [Lactococcus petauri]|uniref:hypothetical protein n=1 Tax=Lactococcus petauri TaxID=1940789 RepID=UPI00254B2C1A|nr:hypothetical protein [Lactococcus petauri]
MKIVINNSEISNQEFDSMQIKCYLMTRKREKKLVIRHILGLLFAIAGVIWSLMILVLFIYRLDRGRFDLLLIVFFVVFFLSFSSMAFLSVFAMREKSYVKKYFLKKYLVSAIEYDEKFVKNTIYTWVFVDTICVLFKENKKVKLFILKQADNPEFYQKMKVDYSKKNQRPSTFQYIRYLYFEDQGIEGD